MSISPKISCMFSSDPRHIFSDKYLKKYFLEVLALEEYTDTEIAQKSGILTAAMSDPDFMAKYNKIKELVSKYSNDELRSILSRTIENKNKLSENL